MDYAEKTRENRLRRVADRRGYRVEKCRARDPQALGYGRYALYDYEDRQLSYYPGAGLSEFTFTLDDLDLYLTEYDHAFRLAEEEAMQELQEDLFPKLVERELRGKDTEDDEVVEEAHASALEEVHARYPDARDRATASLWAQFQYARTLP